MKIHLSRDDGTDTKGFWCNRYPPAHWMYVTSKWTFISWDSEYRCAKCGLLRDLDEAKHR